MQVIHAVEEISHPSFALEDETQTQALLCARIDLSMCFGMHTTQQKLLISSLQKDYLMGIKEVFHQSTFETYTCIDPDIDICNELSRNSRYNHMTCFIQ